MNLLKIFKKTGQAIAQTTISNQEAIAIIHESFDTASDKLLKDSQIVAEAAKYFVTDKGERLLKIGFTNSTEGALTKECKQRAEKAQKDAEIVLYYQKHYPFNKFITKEQVNEICNKWGLVCGNISQFKGFVPEKNLKEIENFKLRDEDYRYYLSGGFFPFNEDDDFVGNCTFEEYKKEKEKVNEVHGIYISNYSIQKDKPQFKICAPISDMKTDRYTLKGNFLVKDEPIVLQPVKGGYLVVSKWGLEANDELLTNSIDN